MKILKTLVMAGMAASVFIGFVDVASARHARRGIRHYAHRHVGDGNAGAGLVAGSVLGLLGAGLAGASSADNGYGYGFPAYGSGYSGYGSYGPGYGYYGY